MTASTVDRTQIGSKLGTLVDYGVGTGERIYQGCFVILNALGYAGNGQNTELVRFAGVADEPADNTSGANAAINCRVRRTGVYPFAIASATVVDLGKTVYLTDNQTVTLTAPSAGIVVGTITAINSSTEVMVDIGDAARASELSWATTTTSTTDYFGIGTVKERAGKRYRWVKVVDQAGAVGEVVYPASATQWDVSTDTAGGSALSNTVKGVIQATTVALNSYCFVAVKGSPIAVREDGSVAAGESLTGHASVDGEADTMADGLEEAVFGEALTASGTTAVSGQDSVWAAINCE